MAASLLLVVSAGATTTALDPTTFPGGGNLIFVPNSNPSCGTDAACGTLQASHGGQTVGWGYSITNDSNYWFVADPVIAVNSWDPATLTFTPHEFSYATPNNGLFDYPILAPTETRSEPWVSGTSGLFEIQWNTGLPYNRHEAGFFLLSGSFL